MRFLVDNAVAPSVSTALQAAGHDSIHARLLGIHDAADDVVLDRALADGRTIITADTDFSALLARRSARQPSVIQFRHGAEHRPRLQAEILIANLPSLGEVIDAGAVVTIEPTRIRTRLLPLA